MLLCQSFSFLFRRQFSAKLLPRPPVITIMGHVDHGKTTLLDALRKSQTIESGGITQHIGAFKLKDPSITFIDTPGHAAFTKMRSRGAKITDVIILVVAVDDGLMPQTLEAIKIAQENNVPVIVALNKCDLAGDRKKIKNLLMHHGIILEEFGGDIQCVEISALKKEGMDNLLSTITAECSVLDLEADPGAKMEGVIIESRMDKGRGIVATVLVQQGMLRKGKMLVAGKSFVKVRDLVDENGTGFEVATVSDPVELSGWKSLPEVGETVLEVESEEAAKRLTEKLKRDSETPTESGSGKTIIGDNDGKRILVTVVKGDVSGSVEAIMGCLKGIESEDSNISMRVISHGVGAITENDVRLLSAGSKKKQPDDALIIGFNNPKTPKTVEKLLKGTKIHVVQHSVIYHLLDQVQKVLDSFIMEKKIQIVGKAEILQVYDMSKMKGGSQGDCAAGCSMLEGQIKSTDTVQILRGEEVIHTGLLKSLKHHAKDIQKIDRGLCGMVFEGFDKFARGDTVRVIVESEEMRGLQ